MRRLTGTLATLASAALCHVQSQEFFSLVQSGQADKVEAMLKADPLLANPTDRAGRTPLYLDVSAGNTAMACLLIDSGMKKRGVS